MAQLDLLSDLTDLRLSDNDFEEIEMTFEHLHRLERVHLNGKRQSSTGETAEVELERVGCFFVRVRLP